VTTLLDAGFLIAMSVTEHVHYPAGRQWLAGSNEPVASCPITQGSLVRYVLWQTRSAAAAQQMLARVTRHPRHVFWPDDIGYNDVPMDGIVGHSQVTDAYLAQLARVNQGRLATFDEGLAALHSDVAELVPLGV
jgi:toxin-antitoxin system PIN domain toxin